MLSLAQLGSCLGMCPQRAAALTTEDHSFIQISFFNLCKIAAILQSEKKGGGGPAVLQVVRAQNSLPPALNRSLLTFLTFPVTFSERGMLRIAHNCSKCNYTIDFEIEA